MKRIFGIILCVIFLNAVFCDSVVAKDLEISAKAYILIEATTGRTVDAKNENLRLSMASTTKIMTALITLEQQSLNTPFAVDANAIKVEGSSMGLREGDKASFFALASGMLLSSGNDAANAAAVKIAGSQAAFSKLMNERAQKIGMNNSHFVTPSGLDDKEHYSTAYDMALLARAALQNEAFLSICSSKSSAVEFGNPPYKRHLSNHNLLLKEYDGCIGVKTGFTKKSGRCLVSAARRNNITLICVTLNASNDWEDHKKLLDYGFSEVKPVEITPVYENIRLNVVGSQKKSIGVMPLDKTYGCVTPQIKLTQEVYVQKFYYAPIKKGDIVGSIKHIYKDGVVAVTDLVASENADITVYNNNSFIKKIKEFLSNHIRQ